MIDTLVGHHQELLAHLTKLEALKPAEESRVIASMLGTLGTKLVSHLELENRDFYPALRARGDQPDAPLSLKTNIKLFFDEMEALKAKVTAFLGKWNAGTIASSPAEFRKELGEIGRALRDRISREENRLYPLYTEHVATA